MPINLSFHQDPHIIKINTQMGIFIHQENFGGGKLTKAVNLQNSSPWSLFPEIKKK
jgi:hypothetical protein